MHSHLGYNSTDDGIGLGCLGWQLGSVGETIDDITGETARGGRRSDVQMDNAAPLMLSFKSRGEGGNLKDTAPIVPDGTDSPSGRVVIGVHPGASEASGALSQLSFDAQKLCGAATELLQQGDLGFPVGKNLTIRLKRR